MKLKPKRKVIEEMNISFWKSIEREEEEKKAQLELSSKINSTLTECLRLIEEVSDRRKPQRMSCNQSWCLEVFLESRGNGLHLDRNPATLKYRAE